MWAVAARPLLIIMVLYPTQMQTMVLEYMHTTIYPNKKKHPVM